MDHDQELSTVLAVTVQKVAVSISVCAQKKMTAAFQILKHPPTITAEG